MNLAHKIALTPTKAQRAALAKAAGCARVAWNWGVAEWKRQYEASKADPTLPKPKGAALRKQWNSVKHGLYPWMKESPKDANIEALFDVETAFKRFFTGVADHPVFHTRSDVLHKATTQIASTYETVVIEDLSVAGMTRSGKGKERRKKAKINRSILDAGFREFRRQLEYKVPLHGGTLVITPRYYASSKRCSGCGHMKETLEITERIYTCEVCGQSCHRDKNAALNLCTLGWRGIDAHGQERRPEAEQSVRALLVEVRNKAGTLKNVQVL